MLRASTKPRFVALQGTNRRGQRTLAAAVRAECERLGIRRPLVCTDAGVMAAGLLDRLKAALGDLPHAVFAGVPSNPTERSVMLAVADYNVHGADGLIALGGRSPIDLGKGVAIMATHPRRLSDYATIRGGSPRITPAVAPLIVIPTTAATGSEVARCAIIILDDGRKLGFHSWHLMPKVALRDPELTLGLPPRITAATGTDAVAHCVETYLSKAINPSADASRAVNRRIGLPAGLGAMGIGPATYEGVIANARQGPLPRHQPARGDT